MATEILLPKLGFSMNEGVLSEWLVADGGAVKEGDPLFSLESDKSVNEVESPATGTLKILKPVGETYEVGTVLGEIVEPTSPKARRSYRRSRADGYGEHVSDVPSRPGGSQLVHLMEKSMRFHHMAVIVGDMQEAIHLWRDVLGFTLQVEKMIPDGPTAAPDVLIAADTLDDMWKVEGARSKMGWLRSDGGAMIELQECEHPRVERTPPENLRYAHTGIHELGLQVDDIDHWFQRVREAGYETTTEYVWTSGDFAKSFLFCDRDGNMIQLWEQIPKTARAKT